jgi:hypothetical protein
MEALVWMSLAVLVVVLFDGVLLARARRHVNANTPKPDGTSDPGTFGPSIDFGDHR